MAPRICCPTRVEICFLRAQYRRPKALGQRQSICANPERMAAESNRLAKNNVRALHAIEGSIAGDERGIAGLRDLDLDQHEPAFSMAVDFAARSQLVRAHHPFRRKRDLVQARRNVLSGQRVAVVELDVATFGSEACRPAFSPASPLEEA